MSLGHSPRIITDGLVLCLDAANPKNFNLTEVEVLVVAGGGGGGAGAAGGGGGGGVIYNRNFSVTPGSALTVTVGDGGTGKVYSVSNTAGGDGGNSVFGSLTAIGGGGAGNRHSNEPGKNGGSGGGCGGSESVYSSGTGTSGQGFAGGTGRPGGGNSAGGGGGGAGSAGQSSPSNGLGGNGGDGLGFNISGTFTYYGGGGGGGSHTGRSSGGLGGGGAGSENGPTYNAVAGTTNTGGGGGGGGGSAGGQFGGNGGSGIVIVRYQGSQKAIGGTVTTSAGYTIHTFTTVGSTTFTPLVATNNSAILGLSDLSGRGNFGKCEGGVLYSSANGGSLSFDGSNDYINCGSNSSLGLSALTLSAWVKASADVSNYRAIIADESPNGAPWNYRLYIVQGSGVVTFDVYGGGYSGVSSTYPINNNQWCHVCAVRTSPGGTQNLYINGILNNSGSDGTTISTLANVVWIGQSPYNNGAYPFNGNIAQVQIYNRALTPQEIQQNFNALRGRYGI